MNARQPIQPPSTPAVLTLSFSPSGSRFVAGTSTGLLVLRSDNCLTTYHPQLPSEGGVAVAAVLDDRYLAFVGGGRTPAGKGSVAVFWDCLAGREVTRLDFFEPVLGVRLSSQWMCVLLHSRTLLFEYQILQLPSPPLSSSSVDDIKDEPPRGPNKLKTLHPTSPNLHALACLRNDLLILPAQSIGQIQLIPLPSGSKRVLRAHNTAIRALALSPDSTLLATASEQGTLIRVFRLSTLDQIAEFRRGSDHADVYSLAFSPGGRWLGGTSDKGTLHIFDLCPPDAGAAEAGREKVEQVAKDKEKVGRQHRKSSSYAPPNPHRLSGTVQERDRDRDSSGGFSNRSTPISATGQGSLQEYYSLRPPPASASPPVTGPGISAMQVFKSSPFAPKIMRDVRSVASVPFWMGEDPSHWQGGAAYSWTTSPNGTRKRVRNPVPSLPGSVEGKAAKGVLLFAPQGSGGGVGDGDGDEEEGAKVYVVGGGGEGRWECFNLVRMGGEGGGGGGAGGWALVNRGFRRYLGRQFVD
ncbi:Phosphatidylinositol 3,5-bisphosphate-binding protein [Elasticomyces elasticus]|nr:Phosphatidylinositol 3,5-bisphosphate-binding protein [Elasticomyces elasticus]KAK3660318.1 Phosphatidylinositol 3,5-bisphosphate-binding protein [Elasticomyces elasticus]KAK4929289.1 Phosphatidylinositol 3,5-bisphosphate-binding protein [Elasticomyces elasticus]KAK5765845.1 Phosphatidylinositol 3,5-bisphosphate-binding protein [Elasticomyces elasticus]